MEMTSKLENRPAIVYGVEIGLKTYYVHGHDDRTVRRLVAAYLGIHWPAIVASSRPGSMHRASCEGWHGVWHECRIYRAHMLPGGIYPCEGKAWHKIECFELSPEGISEFRRVYRKH
jgi:hypothetical protein